MRVLVLTQYYPPEVGGAQTRLGALARELSRRGHDVVVVTALPQHPFGRTYEGYRRKLYVREVRDGIPVHRVWSYAATGKGLARAANYLSFAVTSIAAALAVRRPDVVFTESPPLTLGLSGWLISRLRRAPLVFNVSDLWPDSVRDLGVVSDGPLLRAAERLEAFLYRASVAVNAVTVGIAQTLRVRKGVPAEKVLFLPNGVDSELFAPREPDRALHEQLRLDHRPILLYAGTHGIGMGLQNALAAAKLLSDEACIVFVGAGPTKTALVEQAQTMQLTNVRFVDPVPLAEMPRYYSIASAALVPLVRAEVTMGARPSKLFPALASGVPILYSGEGEGAELVANAGVGVAVEPESPRAIADGLRALVSNPATLRAMSERAAAFAAREFAWGTIVERWLRQLEPLINRRSALPSSRAGRVSSIARQQLPPR